MDASTLQQAFAELDQLSIEEYGEPLSAVLATSGDGVDLGVERVGRLGGVLLKQPFATPHCLDQPSPHTGALRAWQLTDEHEFMRKLQTHSWQSRALKRIHSDLAKSHGYNRKHGVYALAFEAQHERGFFAYFGLAVRRYLCSDAEVRKTVQQVLDGAEGDGGGAQVAGRLTPETIVGADGATLGVKLVQAIPELDVFGAPMIAAMVVVLHRLGVDGFCEWAGSEPSADVYYRE